MRKLSLAGWVTGVAILLLPAAAGAKRHPPHFSGRICPIPLIGQLAALHIPDQCQAGPAIHIPPRRSPLGSIGSTEYTAKWGDPAEEPAHTLFISVGREAGSPDAVKVAHRHWRTAVLENANTENGTLVHVLGFASLSTETESCTNPPTGDCTAATFVAVVGEYFLSIIFRDAPPTDEAAPPTPGEDDSEDNFQEAQVRKPLLVLAKTIMGKL